MEDEIKWGKLKGGRPRGRGREVAVYINEISLTRQDNSRMLDNKSQFSLATECIVFVRLSKHMQRRKGTIFTATPIASRRSSCRREWNLERCKELYNVITTRIQHPVFGQWM